MTLIGSQLPLRQKIGEVFLITETALASRLKMDVTFIVFDSNIFKPAVSSFSDTFKQCRIGALTAKGIIKLDPFDFSSVLTDNSDELAMRLFEKMQNAHARKYAIQNKSE